MTYLVFYIFVVATLYAESKYKSPNWYLRSLIAVVYSLFVGLRGANVGVDTATYYQHYDVFGQFGCDFVEPGFDWIVTTCYALGWKCWAIFLACASLAVLFVHLAISRLPRMGYTIAAGLFYMLSFVELTNGMRQVVACGVFLYGMSFFYDGKITIKKVALYVVLVFMSAYMHASAILLLPVFLLSMVNLDRRLHLVIYLMSFSLLFIDISGFIPTSFELLERDYSRYLDDRSSLVVQASWLGFFVTSLINILVFFLMYRTDAFKKYNTLANLVMIAFLLKNAGFNIPLFGRLTLYFTWFVYIMIAYLYVDHFKKSKVFFIALFSLYIAVLANTLFSPSNRLQPYTTYWGNSNYGYYIKWAGQ